MSSRSTQSSSKFCKQSSCLSSKRKSQVDLMVARQAKLIEQRKQRNERAARRALEAVQREAESKAEEIRKKLAIKNLERDIDLAEARVKAWDETSSRKNASVHSKGSCMQSSCQDKMLAGPSKQEADPLVSRVNVRFNQPEVLGVFQQNEALPQPDSNQQFSQHRVVKTIPQLEDPVNQTRVKYEYSFPVNVDYPPPRPVIPDFDGDPLNYNAFAATFQAHITSRITSDSARLTYLIQYCNSEVRSLIDHYVGTAYGFERAWEKLYRYYGRPLIVASRCEEKLMAYPRIKNRDSVSLRDFARIMDKALVQLEGIEHFTSLNSLGMLKGIVEKLPEKLPDDWLQWSFSIIEETKKEVTFRDLAAFIRREADMASSVFSSCRWPAATGKGDLKLKRYVISNTNIVSNEKTHEKSSTANCKLCKEPHHISRCDKFLKLNYFRRLDLVKRKGLCFCCLNTGHMIGSCSTKEGCSVDGCKKPNHHSLLHMPLKDSEGETRPAVLHSICSCKEEKGRLPYLPVLPVKVKSGNKTLTTYALLDSGSQQTFCSSKLADSLGTSGPECSMEIKTMSQENKSTVVKGKIVDILLQAYDSETQISLSKVFVVKTLPVEKCSVMEPSMLNSWSHLRNLDLPQLDDKSVGLLIGTDHKTAMTPLNCLPGPEDGPDAVKTPLGWIIYGPNSHFLCEKDDRAISNVLNIKIEQIYDGPPLKDPNVSEIDCGLTTKNSREDREAYDKMKRSVKLVDGHLQLPLLWKAEKVVLPESRKMADMRLMHLKRRLVKDESLRKKYAEVMQSYLLEGYAEVVPAKELQDSGRSWFLPHHHVINPKKPEKLRIVFDCAAEEKGVSLNNSLIQGPDLTNLLVGVLTRFREGPVALVADIRSMFHQVKVNNEDKNALKFLWWKECDFTKQPDVCRVTVHLFGSKSSPSCASFALRHTAELFKDQYSARAVKAVQRNFYVDDFLFSAATLEEGRSTAREVAQMLSKVGFVLTKWITNTPKALEDFPTDACAKFDKSVSVSSERREQVLGIHWNVKSDQFVVEVQLSQKPFTRRGLLSLLSSIFDSLGFVAPLLTQPKQWLRDLKDQEWDEEVSQEIKEQWQKWMNSFLALKDLSISRCVMSADSEPVICELHHFADASQMAYGAVSYLRTVHGNGSICCSFLMEKGYLAKDRRTVPQLELLAAVVAMKLNALIKGELNLAITQSYFWSDSTSVLLSIRNRKRQFSVFVSNRLAEIERGSDPNNDWKYVPSGDNPADEVTKEMRATKFVKSGKWLKGPDFLKLPEEKWPSQNVILVSETDGEEHKDIDSIELKPLSVSLVMACASEDSPVIQLINHFSSLYRLKKATVWLLRFGQFLSAKSKGEQFKLLNHPTIRELELAERSLIRFDLKKNLSVLYKALEKERTLTNSNCPNALLKGTPKMLNHAIVMVGRLANAPVAFFVQDIRCFYQQKLI